MWLPATWLHIALFLWGQDMQVMHVAGTCVKSELTKEEYMENDAIEDGSREEREALSILYPGTSET